MYIRKRKDFFELVGIIRRIEADLDDLESVRELNQRLLKLILRSEELIKKHKHDQKVLRRELKTGRREKDVANKIRSRISRIEHYIDAQRDQIFVWKSFGDALAFIYCDTFSLKHVYFDTDDYETKEDSGAMSDKSGLKSEISFFDEAIMNGVPAVLCDLTNTIRFGDVCLLGGEDPLCIEVKTSKKLNQRGVRQIEKLEKLHNFYKTDEAVDFRGQNSTKRVAMSVSPKFHKEALNRAIQIAQTDGASIVKPERGLNYAVLRTDKALDSPFDELDVHSPEVFDLNSFKNDRCWFPFTPFFLSIREPEHILDFLEGRLYIVVLVEPTVICEQLEAIGWESRYKPDDQHSIQLFHEETGVFVGVSSLFIHRAAFEFLSLETIVKINAPNVSNFLEHSAPYGGDLMKEEYHRLLLTKFGKDDEWVKRLENSLS